MTKRILIDLIWGFIVILIGVVFGYMLHKMGVI